VRPLTIGVLLALALLPFDLAISQSMSEFRKGGKHALGGDVLLTVSTLGQFGDAATSLMIGWGFFLVARERRRKLLDWALCVGVAMLVANAMKMGVGRLRPEFQEPYQFLGLWNSYPLDSGEVDLVATFPWEFWHHTTAKLWSMPSSHTVAAVVLAMVLSRLVPRLRPLVFTCAAFVGFNRVLSGYHYPSDVIIGAVVGVVSVRAIYDRGVVDRIRLAFTPARHRPRISRVGQLPALANAIRIQRGEDARPEQTDPASTPQGG
jgi:membrane-associated phospholipid phosphatase